MLIPDITKTAKSIKIITLNVAHARHKWHHHIRVTSKTMKKNLDDIAHIFNREKPDLVALQEADNYSHWSGRFDHVKYLAKKSGYRHLVQGEHVKRMFMSYGTALLSKHRLKNPRSILLPTKLFFPKGFVISTIHWPGKSELIIDVVSLHLDPVREKMRVKQITELAEELMPRHHPIIIMGDFNCDWKLPGSSLHQLVAMMNLKVYNPHAPYMATFPQFNKRYDWILISRGLDFVDYHVLPDHVSDHRAILAEIKLTE